MAVLNPNTNKPIITDVNNYKTVDKKKVDNEFEAKYYSFMGNGNESTDREIRNLMRYHGLYRRKDMKLYNTFYRYPRLDPYNMLPTSREYVFFTKPDLHIFQYLDLRGEKVVGFKLQNQLKDNGVFKDLTERGYAITLSQLQASVSSNNGLFMNLLTNRKSSALDLTDMQADTYESARNYYGTAINYRKSSETSDENVEFSIEFEDTKWFEVYLLFRAYDEYEKLKWYGKVCPPRQDYIWWKILHDQFGIFKFIVGEDGETILHWSQFWGVYPTNVPRSAFSDMPQDGHMKITVSFKAQFVEDMNLNTILDFNAICKKNPVVPSPNNESKIYDYENQRIVTDSVQTPYIVKSNGNPEDFGMASRPDRFKTYKLKWYTNFDRDTDE